MRNKTTCRIIGTIIVLFVIAMGATEAGATKLKPGKARKCKKSVEETRDLYITAVKLSRKKLIEMVNLFAKQKINKIKGVSDADLLEAMKSYKKSHTERAALNMSNKAEAMIDKMYREGRFQDFHKAIKALIKQLPVESQKFRDKEKKGVRKICAP